MARDHRDEREIDGALHEPEGNSDELDSTEDEVPFEGEVLAPYTELVNKDFIGGNRLSCSMLVLLLIFAAAFLLSLMAPVGLGIHPQTESITDQNLNLSLLSRYSLAELGLPQDGATVQGDTLRLNGRILPQMTLRINDQKIETDAQGAYAVQVPLTSGANRFTFVLSLGNRTRYIVRTYFAESKPAATPDDTTAGNQDAKQAPMRMQVYAWPATVWLEVTVDGQTMEQVVVNQGKSCFIEAESRITIRSQDGQSTFVILNGQQIGPLREDAGEAEREYTLSDIAS